VPQTGVAFIQQYTNVMFSHLRTFYRLLHLWRVEHERVGFAAAAVNLGRARIAGPVMVLVNFCFAAFMLVQLWLNPDKTGEIYQWERGVCLAHLAMLALMLAASFAARELRHASRSWWGQWLPWLMMLMGTLFSVVIVTLAQKVSSNITAYIIVCQFISLVLYLRPVPAAVLFVMAYTALFWSMGLTQADADILLSNRLTAGVATAAGWVLSVVLWRKFTTITLRQAELEGANNELQEKQRELERLTRNDGLTGLFNRNTFVELTQKELDRAQRQGTSTTILLMDLDFFKRVNDTWGHPAGDAVLKHVATITTSTVRSTDLVGRLGGEEFIVLLPGTSVEAAYKLAEKLRATLQANPARSDGVTIPITVSIGLAGTTAEQNLNFDTLYRDADKALYIAKQQGRNRVI
jgi:diguanylate cyclase